MKKIFLLLITAVLVSCSADDAVITEENVALFVEHYKTTSVINPTALVVQEGGDIGTDNFIAVKGIRNFEFVPGFTNNLTVKKVTTENNGTNGRTFHYELININSTEAVDPNATFKVPLTRFVNGIGFVSWVGGSAQIGFTLGNEIRLDCSGFCADLEHMIQLGEILTGAFKHGEDGSYKLVGLE